MNQLAVIRADALAGLLHSLIHRLDLYLQGLLFFLQLGDFIEIQARQVGMC